MLTATLGHCSPSNSDFPLEPQAITETPTESKQTRIIDYPQITAWLQYCDNHASRSGEDFCLLARKFSDQGYRRIHQLTSRRIGKGTADLLIEYADEDAELVESGVTLKMVTQRPKPLVVEQSGECADFLRIISFISALPEYAHSAHGALMRQQRSSPDQTLTPYKLRRRMLRVGTGCR